MNMMRRSTFRIEVVGAGRIAVCVRGHQAASYRGWNIFLKSFQLPRASVVFWDLRSRSCHLDHSSAISQNAVLPVTPSGERQDVICTSTARTLEPVSTGYSMMLGLGLQGVISTGDWKLNVVCCNSALPRRRVWGSVKFPAFPHAQCGTIGCLGGSSP